MTVVAAGALTCALSLLVGQAVCALCGAREWSAPAPAVGLAVLLAVARVTIELPGDDVTAAVTIAALAAAALLVLRRERARGRLPLGPALRLGIPVLLIVGAAVAIPFVVNWRIAPLGVSVNDDFAFHLLWADALATRADAFEVIRPGYPVGAHALVAALAVPFGDVEGTFIGVILALPALTALCALGALAGLSAPLRVVGAALTGIPYLAAGFLVQTGFKELIVALMTLGVALQLRAVGRGRALGARFAIPVVLLIAGCVLVYGFNGIAWPAATLGCFALLAPLIGVTRRPTRREALRGAQLAVLGLAATLLIAAPELGRFDDLASGGIDAFSFPDTNDELNDLNRQLSPLEVTGLWFSPDLRLPQRAEPLSTLLAVLGLAVALYGAWWHLRRRDAWLLALVAGCLAIYVGARLTSIGFYSAKALAIAAAPVMLMSVRALLSSVGELSPRGRLPALAAAVAAVFVVAAGVASAQVLRNATVRPEGRADELAQLRPLVQGRKLVFLGNDAYAMWDLRGSRYGSPFPPGDVTEIPTPLNLTGRPSAFATPDFDYVRASGLNRFERAITYRTAFISTPPPNWHPVAHTAQYTLWERRGRSGERGMLPEHDEPGAVLNCGTGLGRSLREREGVAVLRTPPVVGPASAWEPGGVAGAEGAPIAPGASASQTLRLPRGEFDLALLYAGRRRLTVTAAGRTTEVPPLLSPQRQHLPAGRVRSVGGPVEVTVTSEDKPALAPGIEGVLGTLVAVPARELRRRVPVARACNRYVDWFELEGDGLEEVLEEAYGLRD